MLGLCWSLKGAPSGSQNIPAVLALELWLCPVSGSLLLVYCLKLGWELLGSCQALAKINSFIFLLAELLLSPSLGLVSCPSAGPQCPQHAPLALKRLLWWAACLMSAGVVLHCSLLLPWAPGEGKELNWSCSTHLQLLEHPFPGDEETYC